jgi:hypothetical protein
MTSCGASAPSARQSCASPWIASAAGAWSSMIERHGDGKEPVAQCREALDARPAISL